MRKIISAKLAGNILLVAFGFFMGFHGLGILGLIPADAIWGGQMAHSPAKLKLFELSALLVTVLFILVIAIKLAYIQTDRLSQMASLGVWVIFWYLVLNTIGNLASGAAFERLIFTPMTVLLALCAYRLAIEK